MIRAALALLVAFAAFGASPAQAQRRLALVIGIAEYQFLPKLRRPVGDAQAVQEALFVQGVEADVVVEADKAALESAVARFTAKLRPGDVALVHFTGHGARIGGDFVLLPADAPPQDAPDEEVRQSGALGLTALAGRLDATGARSQIIIVDACRGDPYEEAGAALSASFCGTSSAPLPEGSFVLFSAGDGQRALDRLGPDDQDPHSVFTRTLLKFIPDRANLAALARDVQGEVETAARAVNHEQRPAVIDTMQGRQILLGSGRPRDVASLPAPRPAETPQPRLPDPPPVRLPAPEPPVARLPEPPALPPARLPDPPPVRRPAPEPPVVRLPAPDLPPQPPERFERPEPPVARLPEPDRFERPERPERLPPIDRFERPEPPVAKLPTPDRFDAPEPPARPPLPDRFERAEPPVARLPPPDLPRPPPMRTSRAFLCGSAAPGAPSFDCRYARSTTEIAVCRDPRLGSCDRVLNDMFERAQERLRGPGLRREQDVWLGRREACSSHAAGSEGLAECIGRTYDRRIVELQELASAPSRPAPAARAPDAPRVTVARGPSFNCRYARTSVEEAVCTEPGLAAKDREMAALFYRTLSVEPGRSGAIEGTQSSWRAARDACARRGGRALADCVDEAYDARIRDLRGFLASR